ncbi:MAG TPA: histidine kinase dimerization/phospho-acceptor domain-containing protein [Acidimicrobiia bacterium]|nr:histidine kinase dimerization/phospho-acceptor domain-containing protein [Acidimicrobiia bacterium]
MSHELKTPIGALIALAETLEVDDDAEVMKRLAGRVLHEAERLGRIVCRRARSHVIRMRRTAAPPAAPSQAPALMVLV